MHKLEAEPTVLSPRKTIKSSRISPAWSVAASVAAVMFVGWMVMQQQVQNNSGLSTVEVAKADIEKNIPTEYLLAHQSYAPSNSAYIQPAAYSESNK
jgi:sigma-E factor negative regulatory protein RseA